VKNAFDRELRFAVRIDRLLWMILGHGHLDRLTVRRARRGKDDVANAVIDHGIEKGECAGDVVVKVLARVLHRLADVGIGGEVNDGAHAVVAKDAVEDGAVANISFDERPPARRPAVSVDQIVEDDRLETGLRRSLRRLTPDVARAPDDQNGHNSLTWPSLASSLAIYHSPSPPQVAPTLDTRGRTQPRDRAGSLARLMWDKGG
jgi:hypothetical protein